MSVQTRKCLCPPSARGNYQAMRFSSPSANQTKRAFTLIELLVVIAIIAVLAGLLLPAGQSALNAAKKTTAKQQVVSIATAITAYETEYGCLPSNSSGLFDSALVSTLCTTNNPRGIVFLEATSWKQGKGGTNASGGFCDPFSSNAVYNVKLDTSYQSSLPSMPSQAYDGKLWSVTTIPTLNKHVAVWTTWSNRGNVFLINSWD